MKIVVTGSLGNISKPLAEELVEKGHHVTVVSSNSEKQKEIEDLGAAAAIGSIEDIDFLTKTFADADAVYTMLPPPNYFDPNLDMGQFWNGIAKNYVQAIGQSGVKRVIHLSGGGAHLEEDSGFVIHHHNAEVILSSLPQDVSITFMRPTSFYPNLFGFIPMIKQQGVIAANYGGEDIALWVSPVDIAAAVAEEFEITNAGRKIRYVGSDEVTYDETAKILGEAIGQPDLKWKIISNEQMETGLLASGMNPNIVTSMIETMSTTIREKMYEDYYRHKPALGKVKLTDFAKEFAHAFNQK